MPRRNSRRAFGSIAYLGKDRDGLGRWRLRFPRDGRRATEVVHGTKRDAEHRLAELHVDAGTERQSTMTVGEAYERWWLPDARKRLDGGKLSKRSIIDYESQWRKNIAPRWDAVPAASVKALDVQDWLDGLPRGSAHTAKIVLSQVLAFCQRYDVIQSNPAALKMTMPSAGVRTRDLYTWPLDELRQVWAAVRGTEVEAAVLCMAFGGARVGESLGPLVDDVFQLDVDGSAVGIVRVVRQVLNHTGEVSDALKRDWCPRPLILPGPMGSRIVRLAEEARDRGDTYLTDDGIGFPCSQASLSFRFEKALRDAGLDLHPPGRLRSSWETYTRWTLHVPKEQSEKLMGHLGEGVTAKHYDKPTETDFAMVVAKAYKMHPFADDWEM